jgi:hypothetical protein
VSANGKAHAVEQVARLVQIFWQASRRIQVVVIAWKRSDALVGFSFAMFLG